MLPDINEIYVRYLNMDTMVKEQVFQNADGTYTIIINSRHCYEQQLLSYYHAINHILNRDFEKFDVDDIELIAHS